MKCKHTQVEFHDYRPEVSGIGARCTDCHVVMEKSSIGKLWHLRHKFQIIPPDRKYFKVYVEPPPPNRLDGYKNHHMVRL